MTKKLFTWLSLMAVFILTLQSCRNDQFPEQEAHNNSSAFRLTSKTISLSESKHFAKLSTELQKAEQTFKTFKTNISGKVVNYGNGVSIDTDNVIYIENGPGFHTYTFRINRENAPADAPLENLVLSPLSDGTWKEILVTYTLTEQEKQIMLSGGTVNLQGKISYTVLKDDTYSPGIMQKDDGCYWQVNSYYTWCSEGYHNHGELSTDDGGPCKAEAQSVLVISADWKCPSDGGGSGSGAGPGNPTGDGDNDSSDGGGTGDGSSQPCGGNGVPTQPQSPTTEIGQNDCNDGTPTIPNLGGHPKNTPCNKIKNWFTNTKFKEKYDSITKPGIHDLDREKAYYMRYPTVGTNIPPAFVEVNMPACSTDGDLPTFTEGMGGLMHTHNNLSCDGGTPIRVPSPTDIKTFFNTLMPESGQYAGGYGSAYSLVSTSGGNYMLMYNGTDYPGSIDYFANERLTKEYTDAFQELYNYNENVTQADIEKVFTKFMKEKINKPGLEVYRVTPTSAVKLEYDPSSPNSVKQTPCP